MEDSILFRHVGTILVCFCLAWPVWAQAPPPRSAQDITALLNNYEPDAQRIAALKAELAQPAPSEDFAGNADLGYWERRAAAAEGLGLFSIELDARRKLVARSAGGPRHDDHAFVLGSRATWVGNFAEGIQLASEQLGSKIPAYRGLAHSRLAQVHAQRGDIKNAEQYHKRAEAEFRTALADPFVSRWFARNGVARAEALRQAMLELLDKAEASSAEGKPLHTYAHPLFWAPFSVIGEGN